MSELRDECRKKLELALAENEWLKAKSEPSDKSAQELFETCDRLARVRVEAEIDRLRAELKLAKDMNADVMFRPLGDNHHNALACPYCNGPIKELVNDLVEAVKSSEMSDVYVHLIERAGKAVK